MRPAHKQAHPSCPHSGWGTCDQALREAFGKCRALTEKGNECGKWASDESGWCTQHFESNRQREVEAARSAAKQAERDRRINAALAWHREHPSVWDPMPPGYAG